MLAEEYELIGILLVSFSSGWANKAESQHIISTALTLLSSGLTDESQNIITAESPGRCVPC
jgi:hypothetical protein